MTLFQTALNDSFLLGPLIRLARLDRDSIQSYWTQSTLGQKITPCYFSMNQWLNRALIHPVFNFFFHPNVLFLGIALLFVLSAFLGTQVIGLTTWGLFGLVFLGFIFFSKSKTSALTSVDLVVLLFFMSVGLSTAFSSYEMTSVQGLMKMLTFLVGYGVFRSFFNRQSNRLIGLLWVLMFLGLAESVIGYLQSTTELQPLATWQDPDMNPELRITRVFGSLKPSNPNLLAGFLIPCVAASCGLMLHYLEKGSRWMVATGFCGLAFVSILATLVMTGSRGGYLAIVAMLGLVFLMSGHLIFNQVELKTKRWLKAGWLILLTLVLLGGVYTFSTSEKLQNRVASMFTLREDSSIAYRMNVYQSAVEMFKDNWLVGIGPGNETFRQVYGLYMVPGYNALGAYSVPLEIAVEQGVIGLFFFLLLLALLTIRVVLYMDSSVRLSDKVLVVGLFMGVVGSVTYGAFDTIWYRPAVNLLFWFLVAGLAQKTEMMLGLPHKTSAITGK